MSKVTTENAGEIEVLGGKEIVADNLAGFKDGEKIVAFGANETVSFKVDWGKDYKGIKHVPDGTVLKGIHVLDAAVMEKLGRGKIVK